MEKSFLQQLKMITRFTLYVFLVQVLTMSLLFADGTKAQGVNSVKDVRMTLGFSNESVVKAFKKIESQTEFTFGYNESDLRNSNAVTGNYNNKSLYDILIDISRQTGIRFKQVGKNITAAPKKPDTKEEELVEIGPLVTVQGKVTDSETEEPLPGVNILVKGTSTGTVSDVDGNFNINVPSDNDVLVFTYIGYLQEEIPVEGRTTVNVALSPDVQSLQEVVVIGYQSVNKKDLTGATSVIKPEAASKVTANSLAESIQGLSPGVTVRNTGVPGQASSIQVRGVASFLNTDPLYIIDGMIADANPTINTNDIESIQILKDASAAAIYGSRAANGVIIITTKQGKEGPAKVSLSAKYGVQQMYKRWDMMNSSEFAATQRQQYQNSGLTPPASVAEGTFDPSINTDWQDQTLETGSMQDYNLTISGGSESGNYLISGSYYVNDGYIKGNSFDRGSLRINTNSTKGIVTFGENLLLTHSNVQSPIGGFNPIYDMAYMLPVIPVQSDRYISDTNPEGWGIGSYPDAVSYALNPIAVRNLASSNSNYAKAVGNAFIDVKLTDWLSYKFNAGLEASYDFTKNVRELGVWQYNAAVVPSSVNEDRSRFLSLLFENTLNFNKSFGDHNINGVLGITQQHTSRESTYGGRTDLIFADGKYYTTVSSATGINTSAGSIPTDYKILGYLGRINYSFRDTYLLTLTGRVDQDSRFGRNYRTGFFPSVAAAWRISEENFFNADWVSDLKLNVSYGELGIVPLGSWDYTAYINNNPRAIFGVDQAENVGAYQAQLANPDLRWEERISRNIGVDASFFNNQLSVEFNYYNTFSKDAILNLTVPGYLGNLQGNPPVNTASIRNSGIELAATYRQNKNDFKWDISGNITTIKNTVEDVGNQGQDVNYITSGNTRSQIGRSVGEWFLIQSDGLFQNEEEILNYTNSEGTVIQPNAQPGDIKYIDLNDDGTIDAQDRTFVGSPWPSIQSGAQFNAYYKSFNLNVQLVGVFDYTVYNDVRRIFDSYQNTNFRSDLDYWSPENPGGTDPRLAIETGDQGINYNNRTDTERWLEDASYVRLRNIELGYKIPQGFLDRVNVNSARVYISGQNLFTISKYSGLDPDVTGANIQERGVDNGHYPSPRVLSVGLQCEF